MSIILNIVTTTIILKDDNHYFKCIYRRIFLHLKQNDFTYYSTGKNITGKILIKENIKREV